MVPGRLAPTSSLLICILLCLSGPSTGIQAQAEVKGAVTDIGDAGIVSASVVFVREGQGVTVTTDSYGTYRALLAPGTYEVSVKASGFYEMRRAPFTLQEGSKVQFDFQLLDVVFSDPVFVAPIRPSQSVSHDPYNYQEERLNAVGQGLRPLVLFGSHEQKTNSITYTGLVRHGRQLPAVYTYDLLTVKSRSLTYFPKDGSIQGIGNVVFEDGEHNQRCSKIEISFPDGKPKVRLSE